jgi:hypothetical protein
VKTAAAPAQKGIPARLEGRHHTARRRGGGDTAAHARASATLARRLGATEARDEVALTYGQRAPKVKAAVKKGSMW